jgi:hypothetical protein
MRGIRRVNHGRARLSQPGTAPGFAPMSGGQASPPAPMEMPLAEVLVYPDPAQAGYATIAYRGVTPIWATDGAAIPARAPGRWAQLRAAGRP